MYRLLTFGGLTLARDGTALTGASSSRTRLALLALLARAGPMGLPRDRVLAYLWPDSDSDRARGSLKQAVYGLRRELGAENVITGTTDLRLDPRIITSDVADFSTAIAARGWSAAVDLYRGDFLDGVYLRNSPEFERWATVEKDVLVREYRRALEQLAGEAEEHADHLRAADAWRRLSVTDPLSARYAKRLMEALANAGDVGTALAAFRAHAAIVEQELGGTADQELRQLAEDIRTRKKPVRKMAEPQPYEASEREAPRSPAGPSAPLADKGPEELVAEPSRGTATAGAAFAPTRSAQRRRRLIYVALPVIALLAIFAATRSRARAAHTADLTGYRVAVGEFENRTGDTSWALFGRMLSDWTRHGISRTGLVPVIDAESWARAGPDSSSDVAAEDALATVPSGASLLVSGAYYKVGDSLEIHTTLVDPSRRHMLASVQPIRIALHSAPTGLTLVLEHVMGALAQQVDDRLATVSPNAVPPRYSAYVDYVKGLERFHAGQHEPASALFESAFNKDTSFAAALLWAAITAPTVKAQEMLRRLGPARSRLAPVDRHGLDFMVAIMIPGKTDIALEAARRASQLAPQSQWTWNRAFAASRMNRHEEALSAFESLNPSRGWLRGSPRYSLLYARLLHRAGRYSDERRVLLQAMEAHGASEFHVGLARVAATTGKVDEAEREIAAMLAGAKSGVEWRLYNAGIEFRLHGQEALGARTMAHAEAFVRKWLGSEGVTAPAEARQYARILLARTLYYQQRYGEARSELVSLLREIRDAEAAPTDRSARTLLLLAYQYLGLTLARTGHESGAREYVRALGKLEVGELAGLAVVAQAGILAALRRPHEAAVLLRRAEEDGTHRGGIEHENWILFEPVRNDPALAPFFVADP